MSEEELSSSSAAESSDEEVSEQESSDVEDAKDDEPKTPVVDAGPSEAELAMKRRRAAQIPCSADLDDAAKEMLEANIEERAKLEDEIEEMKKKSDQRKKERKEEERRATEKRDEDESRRKGEEEERKRKKEEEEKARKEARATKMAEFEKLKNPQKRNFVISGRKAGVETSTTNDESDPQEEKKTREQLDAEKKVAMAQRISPLAIEGFDSSKLIDRAKELRAQIMRLESEKYDLEKQFKEQQYDMLELAERARSINQVGKGGLKRLTEGDDKIQERFAGAPAKIVMYSQFERQKDKRSYVERFDTFTGATYLFAASRIPPTKCIEWSEDGLPSYIEFQENGTGAPAQIAVEE